MEEVRPLSVEELFGVLRTFGFAGADVGQDGGAPEPLVLLRLSQAVLGAAEAHKLYAEGEALAAGVDGELVTASAAAVFAGAGAAEGGDPLLLLRARTMDVLAGLTQLEPDPRAPAPDVILAAAVCAAAGLAGLLAFRAEVATAATRAAESAALKALDEAAENLRHAAERVDGVRRLAAMATRAGRRGRSDLN